MNPSVVSYLRSLSLQVLSPTGGKDGPAPTCLFSDSFRFSPRRPLPLCFPLGFSSIPSLSVVHFYAFAVQIVALCNPFFPLIVVVTWTFGESLQLRAGRLAMLNIAHEHDDVAEVLLGAAESGLRKSMIFVRRGEPGSD